MSVGRSKPKRRAPAGASPHRPGVVAALVAVLGVLLVLLLTWGNRAPERRGPVTGRATRDDAPPSATARSDTFRSTPESPPGDSADRGDRPVPRRGGSRRRPSRDEGAPAAGGIGSASPGQPGAVAGEVGAEDEALGEGQQEDSGSGQETEAVDPLAFANRPEKEYETGSETDAGKLKGLTGEGGTISFWLQPAWDGTNQDDASFVRIGDDRVRLYKSATSLRFEITDANGQPIAADMPITDWHPGDWHQVLTTWDGRNAPHVISFFVDGNLVGQTQYEGQIELPSDPKLYVGTNAPKQPVARGVVADVNVQNRVLSLDAVSRRFQEGRSPHR